MSTSCDIPHTALVDWLYGELSPADSERFERHLEDCASCAREAASASATRTAARALEPIEPPAAMTQLLLREAARRAPAAEAKDEGLIAWLVGLMVPIFTHPAMATAACVVLVAGVTGVLYLKNGSDLVATPAPAAGDVEVVVAEPAKSAPAAAEASAPSPEPEPSTIGGVRSGDHLEGYAADLADKQDISQMAAAHSAKNAEKKAAVTLERDGRARTRRTKHRPPGHGFAKAKESAAKPAFEATRRAAPVTTQSPEARPKPERYASPPPPPQTAPARAATGNGQAQAPTAPAPVTDNTPAPSTKSAAADTSTSPRGDSDDALDWANATLRKLFAAAKNNRCSEAARLANDLRDRAPTFYERHASGSQAVRKCRTQVASERQRRARTRGKNADRAPTTSGDTK